MAGPSDPMTPPSKVAEIARSLTKAQRTLLLISEPNRGTEREFYYKSGRRIGSSRLAVVRSLEPHIVALEIDRHGPSTFETAGRGYFRLTPLGLAVKAHLQSRSREQQG